MPDFGRWTNGGDPSLNEINRTDRFLDALAAEQQVYATDSGEAELAQLLAGWRDEVREPPLMAPVTPRDAAVALTRALESRKRTRTSMALVGSVAAAVLCLGGFGAVVAGAGPGEPLYGLHTMLFGEQKQTRSDQVTLASQQLAEVQQLIDQGQWAAAQDKLQTLTTTVATVNDVEQKQELVTQWQELTVKVDAKDASATLPPGAPPPPMPEPVVVAPGSDTSTTTSSETSSSTSSSETATSSSETTSSTTTSSPTSSSPVPEPPPPSGTPTTTTAPPTTTTNTTTTTTHAVTTTTTTSQAAAPPVAGPPADNGAPGAGGGVSATGTAPPAGGDGGSPVGGGAQVVAPPVTVTSEVPRQRGPESPVSESQATVTIPVTTTTLVMPPPKKHGDGE
ncbi:MAG: anti-sigma-D factor RsdA [Mycobacterium sp.]|uniref:anti-sigma-D factor RsdA n=1 Tax=Mycobacterium sp. TaxID=1785 RepID=UPI00389A5100